MEKYSVLMSVYYKEKAEYLKQAIESMLTQTVKPEEFVIVCDGPLTDELDIVINEYADKFPEIFNIVRLPENRGLAKALNAGMAKCRNNIIARMDSDDISMSDRMERQLKVMEAENVDIISGTVVEFTDNVENIGQSRVLPQTHEQIKEFAKKRSPFNHPAVTYRKEAVIDCGMYEDYRYFEDYNLWATMLNKGYKGYNIKEPVLYMRAGADMYKRRGGIKYVSYIFAVKKHLKDMGFITRSQYLKGALAHSIVSIMPNSLRKFVYARFLRK